MGRIFFPFFSHKLSITFELHANFFFRQALAGIFLFKITPPPPSRVKWSAPNLIKRAKHPRKSLLAASYPALVISNAKVNRPNFHVQHTFLHIVVRADDSVGTKISWMHFGRFAFTQNLRNFGNSGNWYSIFPEKFPDFLKLFRNANHSTRNFRHSGAS